MTDEDRKPCKWCGVMLTRFVFLGRETWVVVKEARTSDSDYLCPRNPQPLFPPFEHFKEKAEKGWEFFGPHPVHEV